MRICTVQIRAWSQIQIYPFFMRIRTVRLRARPALSSTGHPRDTRGFQDRDNLSPNEEEA